MTSQMRIVSMLATFALITSNSFLPANSAGRTNKSIANTVLSGKGAPAANLGINGDFYIDVTTFNIYGPKNNNRWPSSVSLKGPAGNDGKPGERGSSGNNATGSRGEKGDKGEQGEKGEKGEKGDKGDKGDAGAKGDKGDIGLTGATGLQGLVGAQGLKGDKGDKGDTGLTGPTGLTGAAGLIGATGATGAKGDKGDKGDTGATGPQGLQGLKGDTGTTGAQGPTGAQGQTGATGAVGPSNVQVGSLVFPGGLQGNEGVSISSANFGNLEAGKSYVFDVLIWGKITFADTRLSFSASAIGATPTVTTHWISAVAKNYRGLTQQTEYSLHGKIIVNGSSTINSYQLAVTVVSGTFLLSSEQVLLNGGFTGQLVGSITG